MLGTYPASFDQELEIAGHLDSVARLLRDSRSYEAIAPELDAIHLRIEVLDTARVADGQRRIRIVQGQ